MVRHAAFAVPGDLSTPTGGYAYDRRMIAELQHLGWRIDVVGLGEGFPWPSDQTRVAAKMRLMAVQSNCPIVVDGLAFGVLPDEGWQIRAGHPIVALVHHPLAMEYGLSVDQAMTLRGRERMALACTTRVVTTSDWIAHCLAEDYAVPLDKVVVVPPGIDPAPMSPGSSDGIVRLLSVGAIVPRKGFDVLIAGLATLSELPWRLSIAGACRDPMTAAKLDEDIERFRLRNRVKVLGAVSPKCLAELYRNADAFVLASRLEGYGMAYAEALAHGLPVIGTTAGAIPYTVPANAGVLVAPDDAGALSSGLRQVIADVDFRRKLAESARRAASRLPAWRDSAAVFANVLESVA